MPYLLIFLILFQGIPSSLLNATPSSALMWSFTPDSIIIFLRSSNLIMAISFACCTLLLRTPPPLMAWRQSFIIDARLWMVLLEATLLCTFGLCTTASRSGYIKENKWNNRLSLCQKKWSTYELRFISITGQWNHALTVPPVLSNNFPACAFASFLFISLVVSSSSTFDRFFSGGWFRMSTTDAIFRPSLNVLHDLSWLSRFCNS